MKKLRQLLRWMLQYNVYRIYAQTTQNRTSERAIPHGLEISEVTDGSAFANSADSGVRDLAHYAGKDTIGVQAALNGEVVGGCWLWFGDRYKNERGFIPLAKDEAKLVQIAVVEKHKGKAFAPAIANEALKIAGERGFRRVLGRIWHSHTASIRAFEKAGWTYEYMVVVARPFSWPWPVRLQFNKSRKSTT